MDNVALMMNSFSKEVSWKIQPHHNHIAVVKKMQEGYCFCMAKSPKEIALNIITRRDHSVREMKMKLAKKGVSEGEIADTVSWLMQKRLLNDKDFAQKRAEAIFRTKMVGPRAIDAKLREAGISEVIRSEVVDSLASDTEWSIRAKKALESWKKVHPKHAGDRVRIVRFLASRGFENSYE